MEAMMGFFKDYFPNCVQFAEIGEGNLNWPAIIEAGLAAGSKYLIVETGRHLRPRTNLKACVSPPNTSRRSVMPDCF